MNIPALDLKAQYESIKQDIEQKIQEILSSQSFILGSEVKELEKELAEYSGARFGVGVSSGSDALIISLMALEVGAGDAVITTPFSFFATAGAIARVGARIVFCDIDEQTCNMSPERLAEVLETEIRNRTDSRIKAIIPVHLYGQCADLAPLLNLAKKSSIPVIEDAAQAIGADYPFPGEIKRAGAIGDMGIFSFYPSKVLGAYGDGGMVLTSQESWAEKLKILRVHGAKNKYYHDIIGGNFRLDSIQAGVLRVKFKYLDEWIRKRQEKASVYDTLFEESDLITDGCIKIPEAVYKKAGVSHYHTYHQYVVRAQDRDNLQSFLKEKGIVSVVYYPLALHLQKCFAHLGYKEGDFPAAEKASAEVLALPIYPELSPGQQENVVSAINDFYQKGHRLSS